MEAFPAERVYIKMCNHTYTDVVKEQNGRSCNIAQK